MAIYIQRAMTKYTETSVRGGAGEREPLITRWTNGSDDVFESPSRNQRTRYYLNFRRQVVVNPINNGNR